MQPSYKYTDRKKTSSQANGTYTHIYMYTRNYYLPTVYCTDMCHMCIFYINLSIHSFIHAFARLFFVFRFVAFGSIEVVPLFVELHVCMLCYRSFLSFGERVREREKEKKKYETEKTRSEESKLEKWQKEIGMFRTFLNKHSCAIVSFAVVSLLFVFFHSLKRSSISLLHSYNSMCTWIIWNSAFLLFIIHDCLFLLLDSFYYYFFFFSFNKQINTFVHFLSHIRSMSRSKCTIWNA